MAGSVEVSRICDSARLASAGLQAPGTQRRARIAAVSGFSYDSDATNSCGLNSNSLPPATVSDQALHPKRLLSPNRLASMPAAIALRKTGTCDMTTLEMISVL